MCLGIPGKVIKVEEGYAEVNMGGNIYKAGTQLVEDIKEGDYVLMHAGYILEKLDEEEALKTLSLFKELEESEG